MTQDITISGKTLDILAEVVKRIGNGSLTDAQVAEALQALVEHTPVGESSLAGKIVAEFEGFGFTETNFAEHIVYDGQVLKRHRNGGGWVPAEQDENDPSKPFVAYTAYVGPRAMVLDNARVFGSASVSGDAQVFGNTRVFGDAWVSGSASVSGDAQVSGDAWVSGNTRVFGDAWVSGSAWVSSGDHTGKNQ